MVDKITPTTIVEEWCGNGDGTYNGVKLVQFMFYSVTGSYMSEEEAKKIVAEAQTKQ